jgi:hypothetical protein
VPLPSTLKKKKSQVIRGAPYSLNKEVTVTTDASKDSLAACVTQEGHPVIYVSRTLSKAEQNYSNIEREALAVTWSILRLKHFFNGSSIQYSYRSFTIATSFWAKFFNTFWNICPDMPMGIGIDAL